jgi:hypothetical protein
MDSLEAKELVEIVYLLMPSDAAITLAGCILYTSKGEAHRDRS